MLTKKLLFLTTILGLFTGSVVAAESVKQRVGVVNFATCIQNSKFGKKEQENLENLRNQMTSLMKSTEEELEGINKKLQDPEYRDGLSPKAEEELKVKYQTLSGELERYQGQFYQVLQGANYDFMQKMNRNISNASKKLANKKKLNLSLVINKEACFYSDDNLEVTSAIIEEMDKDFEVNQKLSENKTSSNSQKNISENKTPLKSPKN